VGGVRACRREPGDGAGDHPRLDGLDLEPILPLVRVPTLVLHRTGDFLDVEGGRYIAQQVPGARYVEARGQRPSAVDRLRAIAGEIEEFLTGARHAVRPERALAPCSSPTSSTPRARAAELGDGPWRDLLDRHDALVRDELRRHDGREVKTTGDGFLATFGGPAAAIRCGPRHHRRGALTRARHAGRHPHRRMRAARRRRRGMAVHIGARIGALAAPGEVLVSGTVRDLVVGSVIEFADHGEHELKGVPGRWRVFAVADHAAAGQATAGSCSSASRCSQRSRAVRRPYACGAERDAAPALAPHKRRELGDLADHVAGANHVLRHPELLRLEAERQAE